MRPRTGTDGNIDWCRSALRTTDRWDFSRTLSVIAVKPNGRKGQQVPAVTELLTKNVKVNVKTSFFDIIIEVQKDLEDVSAGTR
jgi:hypothetical protein